MDGALNWIWQGIAVAAALSLMLRALDRASASVRYVVCSLALLIVLAIPALPPPTTGAAPLAATQAQAGPVIAVPDSFVTSPALVFAAWLIWACVQTALALRSLIAVRRIRATCRPFPAVVEQRLQHWMRVRGEGRRTRLVVSDRVGRAAMLGCGPPIIAVAPALLERLSAAELDHVVIHEWAHARRRDDLAGLLLLVIRIAAGWHPAVWWIDRRLRIEREGACDETAVAIGGSAKSYAMCLVNLSEVTTASTRLLASPGVMTTGGLRYRVSRILASRPAWPARRSRGIAALIVGLLLAIAAGVGRFDVFATAFVLPTTIAPAAPALPALERLPLGASSDHPATASSTGSERRIASVRPFSRRAEQSVPAVIPLHNSGSAQDAAAASPDAESDDSNPTAEGTTSGGGNPTAAAITPEPHDTRIAARSGWAAAGGAGVAIGRRSKEAGITLAGAFTRFGRRVAGSF